MAYSELQFDFLRKVEMSLTQLQFIALCCVPATMSLQPSKPLNQLPLVMELSFHGPIRFTDNLSTAQAQMIHSLVFLPITLTGLYPFLLVIMMKGYTGNCRFGPSSGSSHPSVTPFILLQRGLAVDEFSVERLESCKFAADGLQEFEQGLCAHECVG